MLSKLFVLAIIALSNVANVHIIATTNSVNCDLIGSMQILLEILKKSAYQTLHYEVFLAIHVMQFHGKH